MSSCDELSSKFRSTEESHLWFNLGKGSGARRGVHLGAQTCSLNIDRMIFLGGVLREYVVTVCTCVMSQ